jgi:hypothetical protein
MYGVNELKVAIATFAPKAKIADYKKRDHSAVFVNDVMEFRIYPHMILFVFNGKIEGEVPDLQKQSKADVDNFVRACVDYSRKTPLPAQKELERRKTGKVYEQIDAVRNSFGKESKLVSSEESTWMMYPHYSLYFTDKKVALIQNDETIEHFDYSSFDEFKTLIGRMRIIATQFEEVNSK